MVVVRVVNNLVGGEGTSIHWHGIHQKGTQFMDGVSMLTQCPITENSAFEYRFNASNPGTHFWHAHSGLQSVDGLFGAFVVRQPAELEAHHGLYEEDLLEHTLIVHDWTRTPALSDIIYRVHDGATDVGSSVLINGKGKYQDFMQASDNTSHYTPVEVFHVTQGTRYRFRVIGSVYDNCNIKISIDNHSLAMIATDGSPFERIDVDSFNIFAGERYDFVLNASLPIGNYWIRVKGQCRRTSPEFDVGVAILRYSGAPGTDSADTTTREEALKEEKILNPHNEKESDTRIPVSRLVNRQPRDMVPAFKAVPDKTLYIALDMITSLTPYHDGPILSQINHVTHKMPSSPLLSQFGDVYPTEFCHHESRKNNNCTTDLCECTYLLQTDLGDDVELVRVNEGVNSTSGHPMHLHGYSFYVVGFGKLNDSTSIEEVKHLDSQGRISRNLTHAVAKDTVNVPDGGYTILRFKADNPGFWFFHCHTDIHMLRGMSAIIQTGRLSDMPKRPKNFHSCGSWSYTGEVDREEDTNTYAGGKCTDNAPIVTINAAACVVSFLLHMMTIYL